MKKHLERVSTLCVSVMLALFMSMGCVSCDDESPEPQEKEQTTPDENEDGGKDDDDKDDPENGSDDNDVSEEIDRAIIGGWSYREDEITYNFQFTEQGVVSEMVETDGEKYRTSGKFRFNNSRLVLAEDLSFSNAWGTDFIVHISGNTMRLQNDLTLSQNAEILFQRLGDEGDDEEDKPTPDDPNQGEKYDCGDPITTSIDREFIVLDYRRGEVSKSLSGSGTSGDPYLIYSAADLRLMSDMLAKNAQDVTLNRSRHYKLMNDIVVAENVLNSEGDLNGSGDRFERWASITYLRGSLDGNGYSISGLYGDPLLSYCQGTVKDLTIKDSYVGGGAFSYLLSRYSSSTNGSSSGHIIGCVNYATVVCSPKHNRVGGIVGEMSEQTIIEKCINYGKIATDTRFVGGIAGRQDGDYKTSPSEIRNCANYVAVVGERVGGICGQGYRILNCVNYGEVKNVSDGDLNSAGGIVGCKYWTQESSPESNLYNNLNVGIVTAVTKNVGGIVGDTYKYSAKCKYNKVAHNFCLEGCADHMFWNGFTKSDIRDDNEWVSQQQLMSGEVVDKLNDNKRGSTFSKWKTGANGLPVLEWME